ARFPQEDRIPEPGSVAAVWCGGWLGRSGCPRMGATTEDAGPQRSVILAVDLENLATRSDIDVEILAVAPDLHLVLDPAVIQILLRPEHLTPREPILDRRGDRARKMVDGNILLEVNSGARYREPIVCRILP